MSKRTAAMLTPCLVAAAGCQQQAPAPAPEVKLAPADVRGHEHDAGGLTRGGHGTGSLEGTLADWGGGKFHGEFAVDHDKK